MKRIRLLIDNLIISYVTSMLGFVLFFMMARILGAEEYVWIAAGIAVGAVLSNLVELGSNRTFIRAAVRLSEIGETNIATRNLEARLTILPMCLFIAFVYAFNASHSTLDALGLFFAAAWAMLIGLFPNSWYDYSKDTKTHNLSFFSERIVSLAVCLLFLFLPENQTLAMYVALPLLINRAVFTIKQISKWFAKHGNNQAIEIKPRIKASENDGVSYMLAAAMIGNSILTHGNQVVLSMTGNISQLPSYSIAFQIVGIIILFQGQALRVSFRGISNTCYNKIAVRKSLLKHTVFIAGISLILAMAIWLLSRIVVPAFLNGSEFKSVENYVFILGFWSAIAGVGRVVAQYLLEFGMDRIYLKTSMLSGLIGLAAGIVLIPIHGASAVLGILITTHVLMIVRNSVALVGFLNRNSIA